jgi:hypothetical protein
MTTASKLAGAKVAFAQEFLLAKAQSREGNHISDRVAEAMATVSTKAEIDVIEAQLNVWYNTLEHLK